MRIILTESVEKLGVPGDVVQVRDGFARNYLLPQGRALRATRENETVFNSRRAHYETLDRSREGEARVRAVALEGASMVMLTEATDSGRLYGSVSARDVLKAFAVQGISLALREIALEQPIKQVGIHRIRLRLHADVAIDIMVNVARSAEEAEANLAPPEEEEELAPVATITDADTEEAAMTVDDIAAMTPADIKAAMAEPDDDDDDMAEEAPSPTAQVESEEPPTPTES